MEDSKKLSSGKKISFTLIFFIFIGLVLEVGVRIYYNSRALSPNIYERYHMVRRPLYGFTMEPNLKDVKSKTLDTIFSTNKEGFRGVDVPVIPKPEGVFRILCLGASNVFGYGVEDDQSTWPERVEQSLIKKGYKVESLNLGCPGTNSSQALVFFSLIGKKYDPDLIIFYQGWNDLTIFGFSYDKWTEHKILSQESYYACEDWESYMAHINDVSFPFKHSAILFGYNRFKQKLALSQPKKRLSESFYLKTYVQNLHHISVLAEDAPMVIVPIVKKGTENISAGIDLLNEKAKEFSVNEENVHYWNFKSHLKNQLPEEEWFCDSYHFSQKSCMLLGQFLANKIEQQNWIKD